MRMDPENRGKTSTSVKNMLLNATEYAQKLRIMPKHVQLQPGAQRVRFPSFH